MDWVLRGLVRLLGLYILCWNGPIAFVYLGVLAKDVSAIEDMVASIVLAGLGVWLFAAGRCFFHFAGLTPQIAGWARILQIGGVAGLFWWLYRAVYGLVLELREYWKPPEYFLPPNMVPSAFERPEWVIPSWILAGLSLVFACAPTIFRLMGRAGVDYLPEDETLPAEEV